MGYKSKLKQLKRQQQSNPNTNDWAKDLNIITVDIDDDNWLFRYGNPFDSNAKTICQGSLDSCIDLAYKKIPTLYIEPRQQMREHCDKFGILEGSGWHIIYKPLSERDNEPWHQSDIDKFDAAMASVNGN
jgi:hypothetical protein